MTEPGMEAVIEVPLPANWYLSVDGPAPVFDYLTLVLHPDGSVTWRRSMDGES